MRNLIMLVLACTVGFSARSLAQCGGEERWAVKLAADPAASQIDLSHPITTSINDLVHLARPALPKDETTRLSAEKKVRVVEGHLVKFKPETGKTGDSDFHLVISDETGQFSKGGKNTTASSHSFIAEIPDPNCVAGRHGAVTGASVLHTQLQSTRAKFLEQFPNVTDGWNDAGRIPVRLTGVVFFDVQHRQVGRARNGLELHPLIDIDFGTAASVLANGGFESGAFGWHATRDVVTKDKDKAAHSGEWKAWLGGYGQTHSDTLWQQVTLPATAASISLTFYLHIDTEENANGAYDKLRVRVRDETGQSVKLLRTFSNRDAAPGFTLRTFDLTPYKGHTMRISLEGLEDNAARTSFVVDDFKIIVKD